MRLHVHYGDAAAVNEAIGEIPGAEWIVCTTAAELRERLPEIEYLFAPVPPRGIWADARRLKLLQLGGVGADGLLPAPDLPAAVQVCCARGLFADEAAEYAIAAMLAIWRGIPRLVEQQRSHLWSRVCAPALAGRTLAVLGLGEIGRRVARVGAALQMRVVGARRRPEQGSEPEVSAVVGPEGIAELVAEADAIVVTLPRTPATEGLLSRPVLHALRPGAVMVVVSRGGIVDVEALGELAASGRIRGAAIDVFDREPLDADDPSWDRPGVLVSPHQAGFGERYLARALELFVENARRVDAGQAPSGPVDRLAGY